MKGAGRLSLLAAVVACASCVGGDDRDPVGAGRAAVSEDNDPPARDIAFVLHGLAPAK